MSYAKGMDWYLMTSFLFIFLTLVECIVVEKLWRREALKKKKLEKKRLEAAEKNKAGLVLFYVDVIKVF